MTITSADHTCFGDSITYGLGDPAGNGYRRVFKNLILAARPSFQMNFVGPQSQGDSPTNRMYAAVGATCAGLTTAIPAVFGAGNLYNPRTLTVLAGTNNAANLSVAADFVTDYPAMMASLHTQLPTAGFVVSYLPQCAVRQTLLDQLNALLPGMWATMVSAGYILEIATPTLEGPADYDPSEGAAWVHPFTVGYPKLAQAFRDPYLRLIDRLS